jgi:hypothetical protein
MNEFKNFQEIMEKRLGTKSLKNTGYKMNILIKPDFDPDLQVLKDRLDDIEKLIESLFDDTESHDTDLKLEKNPQIGYYFTRPKKVQLFIISTI